MASNPPSNLPLFYKNLQPLSSSLHSKFKIRPAESAPYLANTHAIPITVDEFVTVQRQFPIIFSAGDNPVPLVLMGLNEGVNVYVDDNGKPLQEMYIPAYARRYPFMLARLRPESEELSLCFDPDSGFVGEYDEGNPMFADGQTTETTQAVLKFCEEFEMSAQRTHAFMKELKDSGLLIDGEVSIQPNQGDQPFVYRGFQMISEEKLKELRGDALRKMNQSGMLHLIMAHMFSLPLISDLFGKQLAQGKVAGSAFSSQATTPQSEGALN